MCSFAVSFSCSRESAGNLPNLAEISGYQCRPFCVFVAARSISGISASFSNFFQKEVMRFYLSIILALTKFFTTAAEGSLYLQNFRFLIGEPLYLTLNQTVSQLVGYVNRKRLHKPNRIFSSEWDSNLLPANNNES